MEEPVEFPVCGCGILAQLKTSWSIDNPRMRFFGCKDHGSLLHRAYRFFSWFDPLMTPHARVVLLGLLKRINKNEVQRRKKRLCWFIISVVCIVMIWFV
ncbi:hypothetical protein HRI_000118700 [Hibiscus trionum]|uniref:Uncharacterized protein n=1 Tax=Hibiscus trionum TaxID=183268 RepID=A0A9W7GRT4_HIBTR|nr:hypothetical protein HRI_000118700 [Hibiscus trionum]